MRLLHALITAIAATVTVCAVPGISEENLDPFQCTSLGKGCQLMLDVATQQFTCTCSNNPKSLPELASFYTGINFSGFKYQAYGDYATCQNLPDLWDQQSNSMLSGTYLTCCIYTDKECNKDGFLWTPVDSSIADFVGYYQGTRSFRCNINVPGFTTCEDN